MNRSSMMCVIVLLLAGIASAAQAQREPAPDTIIKNVTVISPERPTPLLHADVVLRDGKVAGVGRNLAPARMPRGSTAAGDSLFRASSTHIRMWGIPLRWTMMPSRSILHFGRLIALRCLAHIWPSASLPWSISISGRATKLGLMALRCIPGCTRVAGESKLLADIWHSSFHQARRQTFPT